jgi:microcystin-dependent protein
MPVPQSIDDLNIAPSLNSPQSSENVGPLANQYFQAAFSFIKQLAGGAFKPLQALNMNSQKLTKLADGDTSSTSTDALTGAQVRALAYKVGEIRLWSGAVANITKTWGPGWQLADGTNGTPDLRDQFIVGAGKTYAVGATGGANTVTLTAEQMPPHKHVLNDPGHPHGVSDPGHLHGADDPGHLHNADTANAGGSAPAKINASFIGGNPGTFATSSSKTGISIRAAGTGISVQGAYTGISMQETGGGKSVENRPPYYALCYLCYTGIGA